MKLVPVKGLGSPAAIEHDGKCKRVLIDPKIWPKIPKAQRRFIIEHEMAHCRYNVFDESEADRIGFINFVKKGGRPETARRAIADNLSLSDPSVRKRYQDMNRRIDQYRYGQPVSAFGPDWETLNQREQADLQRGGWTPSDWNILIDNISDSIADVIVGGGPRAGYPGSFEPYPIAPREQTNWMLIIGIIVAVIVLLIILKK